MGGVGRLRLLSFSVIVPSKWTACHLFSSHASFFLPTTPLLNTFPTYIISHHLPLLHPIFIFFFSSPTSKNAHKTSHTSQIIHKSILFLSQHQTHLYRSINQVSNALRAEFARGDGRVKRKEDERRKKIIPSETLFVVNFHEETTKREDLQMLFEPYGELIRIEMKRNYAFVQFRTVEEATRAKDATNGGKLDQSEITVEYVARRMGEGGRDRGRKCFSFCLFWLLCSVFFHTR